MKPRRLFSLVYLTAALAANAILFTGCGSGTKGDAGSTGATGPTATTAALNTVLAEDEDLPQVAIGITNVASSSSSTNGVTRARSSNGVTRVAAGETLSVTFTLKTGAGQSIGISDLSDIRILVSGPTFNYQPLYHTKTDVAERAVLNSDGSYTYTFADPVPSVYPAPINDTTAFGLADGELQGQAVLSGTYTIGIQARKDFTIKEESFRDAGVAVQDFLFGSATELQSREVITQQNCAQCHVDVRFHGLTRRDVKYCVLCHTAGAEDGNDLAAENGTPGVTIDFRVMIHKIHNGRALPSVLGVSTNDDGSRNYTATATPYKVMGFRSSIHDYSKIIWPVWPSLTNAMPEDAGYDSLSGDAQDKEDAISGGVVSCEKCHEGRADPDGSGPLAAITAPAQGTLAYTQPTRKSCGSCHTDVDFTKPYTANGQTMPAQFDDVSCGTTGCHTEAGTSISVRDAHLHPLLDPNVNAGLNFAFTVNDADVNPGEKIPVTMTIKNDAGTTVAASNLRRLNLAVSGPTTNLNLLLEYASSNSGTITAILGAGPNHTFNLPDRVVFQFARSADASGDSTAALETFATNRVHLNAGNETTQVRVRTAKAGGSSVIAPNPNNTTATMTALHQNFVDVAVTTNFAANDFVVIDDGNANEEYLQIAWLEEQEALVGGNPVLTNRIFFTSPLKNQHLVNSSIAVEEVTVVTKTQGTDFTVDNATGVITEVIEFGTGNAVIVSYTTEYVMPADAEGFPAPALNDSPDRGAAQGEWTGKPIEAGTYTVGIWGEVQVTAERGIGANIQQTNYNAISPPSNVNFLVKGATTVVPWSLISSAANCNQCHNDMIFHGSHRRGFDTCILCHGNSGVEDWANYRAASSSQLAPRTRNSDGTARFTKGVGIDFRSMIHKIHMGEELASSKDVDSDGNPRNPYVVNGFRGTGHTYEEVVFPPFSAVAGPKHCTQCHGATNTSWKEPAARTHSDGTTTQVWRVSCGSCHESAEAVAHFETQTPNGIEACAVCHGQGRAERVSLKHKVR